MNVVAYSVEAVILLIAFTGMIMIPLCKDPVWWIHDFPKDIQEEYFKTHERVPAEPFSKTVLIKKSNFFEEENICQMNLKFIS